MAADTYCCAIAIIIIINALASTPPPLASVRPGTASSVAVCELVGGLGLATQTTPIPGHPGVQGSPSPRRPQPPTAEPGSGRGQRHGTKAGLCLRLRRGSCPRKVLPQRSL